MKFALSQKGSRFLFIISTIILFGVSFYIFYKFSPITSISKYYLTYLLGFLTNLSYEYSAIILLSIFVFISFIVTILTLRYFLIDIYPEKFIILIAIFLNLVTPLFLPIFNTTIYFGQGSPRCDEKDSEGKYF